jgi:exo-beta-1,3-glucanase (GH17 family)/DNA-binding beta-propeller fold protein YncE
MKLPRLTLLFWAFGLLFGWLALMTFPQAASAATTPDPIPTGSQQAAPINDQLWTRPEVNPTRCFDFDKSGVVDVGDIQQVADLWRQPALLPYDCDGDQTVTVIDIMCAAAQFDQACYRLYGVNFSPYIAPGENPSLGGNQITDQELMERLSAVGPYTEWIRTFGCNADLREAGAYAHSLGLKAAIGAWIDSDLAENQRQIDCLLEEAQAGNVDLAIVGSETLLRGSLPEAQLIAYITQVKQSLAAAGLSNIPVAYADVYSILLDHGNVRSAVDTILANYYPYWEGRSVTYAVAYVHRWHQQLVNAYPPRPVIVSETGWPSCGNTIGDAVPSPENSAFYWLNFVSWARANNVPYFYFETYDELWKAQYEGPQGACWGVWDRFASLKPGMGPVFDGATMDDNWTDPPPESPIIDFFALPAVTQTNLPAFVIASYTEPSNEVWLNGSLQPASVMDTAGNFAFTVTQAPGVNVLHIEIKAGGTVVTSTQKTVLLDPAYSTADKRLLYVDSVAWGTGVPALPGTTVIDLDGNTVLGLLQDQHVVGISPDGGEIYTSSRQAISTTTHQVLRTLPFSQDIPGNSFVVAPDGTRLYSRNQRLDVASNTLLANLPADITTGSSWAGAPIPGGPAISPDSRTIYCCNTLKVIDTISNTVTTPGPSALYLSDIKVASGTDRILMSEYSYGGGRLKVYDGQSFALLGAIGGPGDFAGEIALARDGQRAVVGSAGNPAWSNDGRMAVIDLASLTQLSYKLAPLADNLATSGNNEFFVSTGENALFRRQGVDVYVLEPTGQLVRTKTFFLGINRWVSTTGRPAYDQIRRIVFKP